MDAVTPSLYSAGWYRVAQLQPKWRLHVRVDRQQSRDQTWYVLSNAVGAKSSRLDRAAYAIVGRCDGNASLEQVWQALIANDSSHAPTQDEVISVISQLVGDGFLQCDRWPDIDRLLHEGSRERKNKRSNKLNPLSLRIALGNPSRVLRRQTRLAHRLFNGFGLAAWSLLLVIAAVTVVGHADALMRHADTWLSTPRYWLLAWLLFVPVKFIHEWAHALAVRRFGGQVREVGIGLMMFFPAPYVDASDANRFSSAQQRAIVSAAGVAAELALAAIAVLIFAHSEPGWTNDIAFTVAFIGGVSTLAFNANPLVRMDGYFVISDLLRLPNLAARSANHWQNIMLRRLMGIAAIKPVQAAQGERKWLLLYAPSAWLYRIMISLWLVIWAGEIHRWLGAALALLMLLWLLLLPLAKLLAAAARNAASFRQRVIAPTRLGVAIGIAALLLAFAPLPDTQISQGIVWMHEDTQLRAPIEGFARSWDGQDQSEVKAQQRVLQLVDPVLDAERQRIVQRRPGLDAELYATLRVDPSRSRQIQEQLASLDAELVRINERVAQLQIVSSAAGTLGIAKPDDWPGRFVKQGEIVGVVRNDRPAVVRVALTQDDAARISRDSRAVLVRLAEEPTQVLGSHLLRQQPAATIKLPSPSLAQINGGPIQVDPSDKEQLKPAYPTFLLDVELTEASARAHLGGRAWVRFEFGQAPLLTQLARSIRQTIRWRFASESV